MTKVITKASGEQEEFSVAKFQRSLRKAGAEPFLVNELTQQILNDPNLNTSDEIYAVAYDRLRQLNPPVATRYGLKSSLADLGPSGFPFERFVAELFRQMGYTAHVGQEVVGACVTHEVDIVLSKDHVQYMVECKFHQLHLKADVHVPLYIKARFDDISKVSKIPYAQAWCVTNTKFTTQAVAFGECVGMKMISWSEPHDKGLAYMIDKVGMHPITALSSLSRKQKADLMVQGLVLCKDTGKYRKELAKMGLSPEKIDSIIKEAETACELGVIK
jgi:hypothetical protein